MPIAPSVVCGTNVDQPQNLAKTVTGEVLVGHDIRKLENLRIHVGARRI